MKNIFKILGVFFVALIAFSCEYEEYDVPDINLTSVYSISDTDNKNVDVINIYRSQPLLTVWDGSLISSYTTTSYSDMSDDLNYMLTVTAIEKKTVSDEAGNDTVETIYHAYEITADKETGACTISIISTNADESTSTSSLNGVLAEKEVYN